MAPTLKFGYLLSVRNPPGSNIDFSTLYAEMFRQAAFVDQAGFDSIWLTEHHFTDDGYLAAIMPTLAAIAARTKHVSIGTYVLLAPFYHPLRLAEDTATIDVIANGRLRLGIGLGYRGEEFAGFQIPREQRLGRTLETLEILKRAWTGERFSFDGKYFQFHDVRVLSRPLSQPHPQLLWGGMAPSAIKRGAELDLAFACNLGQREVTLYRDTLRQLGKDPAAYSIVNSRIVYVADSAEQAWADIEPGAVYQAALYAKWLSDATGGEQQWIQPVPDKVRRSCVFGSPEEVRQRLLEIIESNQMTELIVTMQLPGLDPAKAMRSLGRFATEVLPALRGL
jgi:alkanesulfonate monooxygenase SsuD/methylene tetrahydromethanopterin reductase-like flavin-dependent oxidoreductase (luciferase family)